MFLCFLGEKYGEKREKNAQTAPKTSPLQSKLPRAFYRPWHTFWGRAHLAPVGAPGQARLMSAISSLCTFSVLISDAHLEVFSDSDWSDLGVPRKLWMSSFHKTEEIKIPTFGSNVMTLGSVLMCFSQFSQSLNRFNSDFDPWIVIGIRILLSSQKHWSQLVLMTESRLGFLGPTESTLGQTWPNFLKIFE